MGGDFGPRVTIPAAADALIADPSLTLLVFGDSVAMQPYLNVLTADIRSRLQIIHTEHVIDYSKGISYALRRSKGSSLRLALEAVQKGDAQGCVSGADTGALMGLARLLIQPISGIQRPALTSAIPTINGEQSIMLDLGANIECSAEILHDFALMGSIFAENTLYQVYPRVGLLNIGIEELKGLKNIRDAAELIKQDKRINYTGYIEGNLLLNGRCDVIVSDGFAGNIALKTLEGTAKNILPLITGKEQKKRNNQKNSFVLSALKSLSSFIGKHFFKSTYQRMQKINPDLYNGATMLGLSSVVVKSHGSAKQFAFTHAINHAAQQVKHNIPEKIHQGLTNN